MKEIMVRTISIVVQVLFSLVSAGGWVMILIAIFGKSKKSAETV